MENKETAADNPDSAEESAKREKPEVVLALEDKLHTEFQENETNFYSSVTIETENSKQVYIVLVDKNKKADVPIKVIPLIPSGRQMLRYKDKINARRAERYNVENDEDNAGEVYLATLRMKRLLNKYKHGETLTSDNIEEYVQEIADWTTKMTYYREKATKRMIRAAYRERQQAFTYANGVNRKCKEIVFSDRAYAAILAEGLARDPLETGGILLGNCKECKDGTSWYVVESTDPGLNTRHTTVHHEMDQKYHNHIYPILSRIYEEDLILLGLWHRHPGNFNRFSEDDNRTNAEYAKVIGMGAISVLLNFTPEAQLTCYYLDYDGTGAYFQPEVKIGDVYFEGTHFLKPASADTLWKRKKQMHKEIPVADDRAAGWD